MHLAELQKIVERVLGPSTEWISDPRSTRFRTTRGFTLVEITALSEALGTDKINFNMGNSGEPAYSEVTPGTDPTLGWIEIAENLADLGAKPGPPKLTLDLDEDG